MIVVRRTGESCKYFQACLMGALLIGVAHGKPFPQYGDNYSNRGIDHANGFAIMSKTFASPTSRGSTSRLGNMHSVNIVPGEDETKRLLEEYKYHFVRVEQGLPPTRRGSKISAVTLAPGQKNADVTRSTTTRSVSSTSDASLGNDFNEKENDHENSVSTTTTTTTTTEYPYNAIAKAYASPTRRLGTMSYSSCPIREDERKRLLEEYEYHFVRVEKGLPPTRRAGKPAPPSKY